MTRLHVLFLLCHCGTNHITIPYHSLPNPHRNKAKLRQIHLSVRNNEPKQKHGGRPRCGNRKYIRSCLAQQTARDASTFAMGSPVQKQYPRVNKCGGDKSRE